MIAADLRVKADRLYARLVADAQLPNTRGVASVLAGPSRRFFADELKNASRMIGLGLLGAAEDVLEQVDVAMNHEGVAQ